MTAPECACGCGHKAPNSALSPQCAAALRSGLRRLPALDRDLEALMDPRRAMACGSGGSGGGLPYHQAAGECRSQIAHDLAYWTAMVAGLRQLAAPSVIVAGMAGWLCGQVPWIAGRPWSADMLAALSADCGRARALLDPLRRAVVGIPGRCPECDASGSMTATVPKDDGDLRPSVITCGGCGHAWDATQWLKLGHVLLQQKAA